jgi:hypothetical protein
MGGTLADYPGLMNALIAAAPWESITGLRFLRHPCGLLVAAETTDGARRLSASHLIGDNEASAARDLSALARYSFERIAARMLDAAGEPAQPV